MVIDYIMNFDEVAEHIVAELKKYYNFVGKRVAIGGADRIYSGHGKVPTIPSTDIIKRITVCPQEADSFEVFLDEVSLVRVAEPTTNPIALDVGRLGSLSATPMKSSTSIIVETVKVGALNG